MELAAGGFGTAEQLFFSLFFLWCSVPPLADCRNSLPDGVYVRVGVFLFLCPGTLKEKATLFFILLSFPVRGAALARTLHQVENCGSSMCRNCIAHVCVSSFFLLFFPQD